MLRDLKDPVTLWRLSYAIFSGILTFRTVFDSLAILAMICDVLTIICIYFGISETICDIFAMSRDILRFVIVFGTLLLSVQPSPLQQLLSTLFWPQTSQLRTSNLETSTPTSPTSHIASPASHIMSQPSHITSQPSHVTNTPSIAMPTRYDRSAPCFDPSQPRELRRYFADLAQCLARSQIVSEQEKKVYASRYVDIDTAELWESLSEFSEQAKSFSDFVQVVYRLYPGSGQERQWLVVDIERLVEERSCVDIRSLSNFGDYLRSFIVISAFLRRQQQLSEIEESLFFMRGLSRDFRDQILRRLQLKFVDHYPEDPYRFEDICDAAQFVLHGTSTTVSIPATPYEAPVSAMRAGHRASDRNVASHLAQHQVSDRNVAPNLAQHHDSNNNVAPTTSHLAQHRTSDRNVAMSHSHLAERRTSDHNVAASPSHFAQHCDSNLAQHRDSNPNIAASPSHLAQHEATDRNIVMSQLHLAEHRTSDRNVATSQDPRCHFCGLTGHFIR